MHAGYTWVKSGGDCRMEGRFRHCHHPLRRSSLYMSLVPGIALLCPHPPISVVSGPEWPNYVPRVRWSTFGGHCSRIYVIARQIWNHLVNMQTSLPQVPQTQGYHGLPTPSIWSRLWSHCSIRGRMSDWALLRVLHVFLSSNRHVLSVMVVSCLATDGQQRQLMTLSLVISRIMWTTGSRRWLSIYPFYTCAYAKC